MPGAGTADNPIVYPALVMPENVERSKVVFWSQGVALDGDLYRPTTLSVDDRVPAVVLAHGIGGDKESGERYAATFAAAGMIALCFSQSGWAGSEGRIYAAGSLPAVDADGLSTARVRIVREVIDPLEWVENFRSALDFTEGEANVDVDRLGAWGTSYGGGTAFYSTAQDRRIKALAVQVPFLSPPLEATKAAGRKRAIQIARGEIPVVPVGLDTLPHLRGTPHFAKMARFEVAEQAERISVPTLIIDAENEELIDTSVAGAAAQARLRERGIEVYYEVLPDVGHYDIYFDGFDRSSALALDWFKRHL